MLQRVLKIGVAGLAAVVLGSSCGGGGDAPAVAELGVFSGFNGNLDYNGEGGGADGSVGSGGDGDGGIGAGGDFGQFRNAVVTVYTEDGNKLGSAVTDSVKGMVTIRPGKTYKGALILELRGQPGATYFEEGKNAFVDFPADKVIRAVVPAINKNIGITPFTEAAYRLLTEGSTAERASNPARPTAAEMAAANDKVLNILNKQFPAKLGVDDVTRLPFIKSDSIGPNSISIDARGRYGLVNGAFSKQAAMYNSARTQPTLDAVAQLGADLLDGVLDGMNGNQPAVAAGARTYDPNTLTGELSSALAEQSYRFGDDASKLALPRVLNFANSRYEGYLFDASLTAEGTAFDTVSGWVGDNTKNFSIGQAFNKLPGEARVFGVYGNMGHGSLYFKANASDSQSKVYVVGDNVNGELGLGNSQRTGGQAVEITLPGVLTHVAGGFAHTVARMADGSVYAWGDNSFGQLGTGGTTGSSVPLPVALPRGAVAVAATNTASYALLDDGSVYAWGSSAGFGLLGDGNKTSVSTTPQPVTAVSAVVQISARDNDVAVLRRDGSVWHWGSFPADPVAFTPGDLTTPYTGGTPLPTQVAGLPAGVAVRKILAEQGLFAALMSDGTVYEWGVFFDITAGTILRDLQAQRVLNLPPIRDMMPGGFIGYGVRPFDRLTAMGVDFRGGMWKIRGRVAEQFDPANPTQQRRPKGQAPRPDCVACHVYLTDWPLTPPAPTSSDVCVPPPDIHGSGSTSLIHAETQCEMCHNPARTPVIPAFPNGWKTCEKPLNLPPRSTPTLPALITTACTIPARHSFTPPGTVCASCHNSVIAQPLQELGCAQPPSSALPTITTTATIVSAVNDANATIASGASTTDTTPSLSGTLSNALSATQSLRLYRGGTPLGAATVSGTTWTFTDAAGAPNGAQLYTARVEAGSGFGPTSNTYAINVDTAAPTQTVTLALSDDISPGTLPEPAFSSDTTPTVSGTLSAALASGESVRVLRGGVGVATLTPTSTAWSYTEPAALVGGTYSYTARVVDAAGNQGPVSAARTITLVTNLPAVSITTAVNDGNATIAAGSFTADTTPTLQGTISTTLGAGQVVTVLRDGTAIGTAALSVTNWSFTDPGAANGAHTYTARSEQGTVFSAPSAGYSFTIDTVAPAQTANVTQISDDVSGSLSDGASTSDTTPAVAGTLSAALGANESVQVLRSGAVIAALVPTGTAWSYTEPNALAAATYVYSARVADAAGNVSVAAGTTRSVTVNTAFPLAGAATTLVSVNGIAPTSGATPASNDSTPTLAGTIQRTLLAGEVVKVYRGGAAVGDAVVSGTNWSFTSAALGTNTYTFLARIEQSANATVFGAPSSSVSVPVDVTAPSQLFVSIVATSSVAPNSTVAGAVPASDVISAATNDPSPTITIVLDSALGAGETLNVTRTVGATTVTVASLTASNCAPSPRCFTFTDNSTGVSIPVPPPLKTDALTAGTTPNGALPSASYTYAGRVTDGVGNLGSNAGNAVAFTFGYFNCDQVRADTTYATEFPPAPPAPAHAHGTLLAAGSGANCASCHRSQQADPLAATPAGTFIAVPRGVTAGYSSSYWCKRP
jgi:hypothetical protein